VDLSEQANLIAFCAPAEFEELVFAFLGSWPVWPLKNVLQSVSME
jgi:hypothetical protein